MIIDCHGHYTTAPAAHNIWRQEQLSAWASGTTAPTYPTISDDELRDTIEGSQLRLMDERGIDVTVFSPRASAMAHHEGDAAVSLDWARRCNDLIHRICTLYPHRFVGVAQLPQSPGTGLDTSITELRRCVEQLGFIGANLNPDPSGGHFNSPPLTDTSWYPLYETMVELDVPAMIHVSASAVPAFHATGAYYLNADTTAFMQLLQGRLFTDLPNLRLVIPHGGGAVPYHWGRYRGLADMLSAPPLESNVMTNVFFDTCVYHQPGIDLLLDVIDTSNILFGSEMVGAVRGIDPLTGHYFDDTRRYIDDAGVDDAARTAIFEGNVRRVYPRLDAAWPPFVNPVHPRSTEPQKGTTMTDYTSFDVAHIGNIELLTAKPDESLWFFRDLLAMRVVAEDGDSVFLRTWDEYQRYTIKLTAAADAGVGRTTFRTTSQDALDRRVAAIDTFGLGEGWVDGEQGTGPTYTFRDPDGHSMGIYYQTERYVATDDKPALKNQASAFPGRGVNARRLDHINYLAKDVVANGEFIAAALGGRESERIALDAGGYAAWWFHFNNKSYDVVYSDDWLKHGNRLHHIAFAPDTREDILKAADIFLENGIHIESGPHKHAINQTFFLYVWEPGGNRIEFANAGARLLLDPDSPVVEWNSEERKKGQAWGMKTIETFHTHGTPVVKNEH